MGPLVAASVGASGCARRRRATSRTSPARGSPPAGDAVRRLLGASTSGRRCGSPRASRRCSPRTRRRIVFLEVGPGQDVERAWLKRHPRPGARSAWSRPAPPAGPRERRADTMAGRALARLWVRGLRDGVEARCYAGGEDAAGAAADLSVRAPSGAGSMRRAGGAGRARTEPGRPPPADTAGAPARPPRWPRPPGLPPRADRRAGCRKDPRWLVLLDRDGWGEAIVRDLRWWRRGGRRAPGRRVPGGRGPRLCLDPSSPDDHRRLVGDPGPSGRRTPPAWFTCSGSTGARAVTPPIASRRSPASRR